MPSSSLTDLTPDISRLVETQYGLTSTLVRLEELGATIAGFITESLLSCGGQVIPPKEYFKTPLPM